jgi:Flp pilus assembly protein TadD
MSETDDAGVEDAFFAPRPATDDMVTDARGAAAREIIEQAFVAARRRRFARYVRLATAFSALVCVVALAKTLRRASAEPAAAATARADAGEVLPAPESTAGATRESAAARDAVDRGDLDGAIQAAARSIALDPRPAATWMLLGDAYERAGRLGEARKVYHACIDEARDDVALCLARLR